MAGKVQGHAAGIGPQNKVSADKLRAQIDPDGLGVAYDRAGQFDCLRDVFARAPEPGVQDRR